MFSKFQVVTYFQKSFLALHRDLLRTEATYSNCNKPIRFQNKPKLANSCFDPSENDNNPNSVCESNHPESNIEQRSENQESQHSSTQQCVKKETAAPSSCSLGVVNMDALVMSIKDHNVGICKVPVPSVIRRDEVSIRVKYAAVTQADLEIMDGCLGQDVDGVIPGRELSGTVCATGDAVKHVRAGETVVVTPCHPSALCKYCASENYVSCMKENSDRLFGVHRNGGWATFTTVPANLVYKVGELSMEQAALLPLLAQVMCSLSKINVKPHWHVLVQGCGLPGMLFILLLRQNGHERVTIWEDNPNRVALLESLAIGYPLISERCLPDDIDIVISNGAGAQVMQEAFEALRTHGQFIAYGVTGKNGTDPKLTISTSDLSRKGVKLKGVTCGPVNPSNIPVDLASRLLDLDYLGVHVMPLDEHKDAFTKLTAGDVNGVLFSIGK